jgi:Uma2 family endonuclease
LEDAVPDGLEVLPEWGWQPEGVPGMFEPDIMVAPVGSPAKDLLRVPPLLIVEVTSPSARNEDWTRKRDLYALHGAGHYWIVDPEQDAITVMRKRNSTHTVGKRISLQERRHVRLVNPFPVVLPLDLIFSD